MIAFNNDFTIPQPSGLKEELTQKLVDRMTIKGVLHRFFEAQKFQATMTFKALTQSQYSQLTDYLYNQGAGVVYTNNNTGVSFFGYPTVAEAEYIQGASYLKDVTVTIIQA